MNQLISRQFARARLRTLGAGVLVVLCMLVIARLAPRASSREVLLLAGLLGVLWLAGRPQWGLILLIAVSLVVPISLGTGTLTQIPLSLLLLVALMGLWVTDMARRREWALADTPANAPLFALIIMAGLSIVVGDALWNPFVQTKGNFTFVQLAQWGVFILSAGAYWLTANTLHDVRWLKRLVIVFLSVGVAYIGLRLLDWWAILTPVFARGSVGSLLWVWLVALAGGQALFNRRLETPLRAGLALLILVTLSLAWFQARAWVSGWAPALAALLLLFLLKKPVMGTLVTAGLALVVRFLYPGVWGAVVTDAIEGGSFARLDAWRGIVQLVGNRWPVGLGLAAYWHYWRDLVGTWAYSATNVVANPTVNSHNNYVDIFAQMGVLGLGIFLWLAVALWRQGWTIRHAVPDGFERGYVYGCLAGLVGSLASGMFADWFLPFVYNIGLEGMRVSLLGWVFLGGQVTLATLTRNAGTAH